MSDAYFSGNAIITIGAASAVSSAGTPFTTYITNWSQSGGDTETETINIFGNANIQKRSPRNEIEVSFDFVMRSGGALLFEQLMMGSTLDGSTAVDSSMAADEKVVYVELQDEEGSTYKTYAYNNVLCTTYEAEMSAEDHAQGSVTLKTAATTAAAAANMKIVKGAASTVSF